MKNKKTEFVDKSIITCPACGFSFRSFNVDTGKDRKKCPKCGYEFPSSITDPFQPDFTKRKI